MHILWLNFTLSLMCGFALAEERKKRKTFFSHTAGSLGSSVWGVSGHVRRSRFTLRLPSAIAWHPPPTHPWGNYRGNWVGVFIKGPCSFVRLIRVFIFPCIFYCKSFLIQSFFPDSVNFSWCIWVIVLIKVRLLGSAWHGSLLI